MLTFWVVLLLVIVSGLISYIGDKVGRVIGRRHWSILGMRPRRTAAAVTVVSGVLIASVTFATFMVLSKEARLALFGLEELRQKIISLEQVKSGLEKEIEISRKGSLLFRNQDVILTTLLPGGMSEKQADEKLKQVLDLLELYVANLGVKSSRGPLILIPDEKLQLAAAKLSAEKHDQILRVKVSSNVIFGEAVPVEFIFSVNRLVFQPGQEIAGGVISSDKSDPEIEQELQILLATARLTAEKKGVIPDASGSLGSIPYAEIFNTVKEIKNKSGAVEVKVVASRPIYSIGPLNVSFSL